MSSYAQSTSEKCYAAHVLYYENVFQTGGVLHVLILNNFNFNIPNKLAKENVFNFFNALSLKNTKTSTAMDG